MMTTPLNGLLLTAADQAPATDLLIPHVNDLPAGTATLNVLQAARFLELSPGTLKRHADEGRVKWYRRGDGGTGVRVQRVFVRRDLTDLKRRLAEEAAAATKPTPQSVPPSPASADLAAINGQIDASEGRLRAQIQAVDQRINSGLAELAAQIERLRAAWD